MDRTPPQPLLDMANQLTQVRGGGDFGREFISYGVVEHNYGHVVAHGAFLLLLVKDQHLLVYNIA